MEKTASLIELKPYAPIDIKEGMRVFDIFEQLKDTGDNYILIGDMLTIIEANGNKLHDGKVKKISKEPIQPGAEQKVIRNGKEFTR